jgi:molybdenum-dependent DNA-binding transcriptional regulator ModE
VLQGIENNSSVDLIAKEVGINPSCVMQIIEEAENSFDCELIDRSGSQALTLTPKAKAILEAYLQTEKEVAELVSRRFAEFCKEQL